MKINTQKHHIVAITDPAEIASIESSEPDSIIGGQDNVGWWAYAWSAHRWRDRQHAEKLRTEGVT